MPLPTQDLRKNVATWAVPIKALPAIAKRMVQTLPAEGFDPDFQGQDLCTTYFDTQAQDLRRARVKKQKYLTLRVRAYPKNIFAINAKTEDGKFRAQIDSVSATYLLNNTIQSGDLSNLLPSDILARLLDLAGDQPLLPSVTVKQRRYAVENELHRFTLDTDICTNHGKEFHAAVLEHKTSTNQSAKDEASTISVGMGDATVPSVITTGIELVPIKLSKWLWATFSGE